MAKKRNRKCAHKKFNMLMFPKMLSRILTRGKRTARYVEVVLLKDDTAFGEKGALLRLNPAQVRSRLYPHGIVAYATDENIMKHAAPFFSKQEVSLVTINGIVSYPSRSKGGPPTSQQLLARLQTESKEKQRAAMSC